MKNKAQRQRKNTLQILNKSAYATET